jgi:hypothetical protein
VVIWKKLFRLGTHLEYEIVSNPCSLDDYPDVSRAIGLGLHMTVAPRRQAILISGHWSLILFVRVSPVCVVGE